MNETTLTNAEARQVAANAIRSGIYTTPEEVTTIALNLDSEEVLSNWDAKAVQAIKIALAVTLAGQPDAIREEARTATYIVTTDRFVETPGETWYFDSKTQLLRAIENWATKDLALEERPRTFNVQITVGR